MIDTIYIEDGLDTDPRAARLLRRFPDATVVHCAHYAEVFNPAAQDFRLQKRRPALILAHKAGRHVLEAPAGFGIGGERNFYFSHMLNCLYDCRYCFLQGMFRSAHYVLFVNFEDFQVAIDQTLARHPGEDCYFFSGYDCDSLALESLTGFAAEFVPFFAVRPNALLELRTKSVAVRSLLQQEAVPNVVVAYSFTPAPVAAAVEHGAPDVTSRIEALSKLAAAGWPLGIRLDPLLWYEGRRQGYDLLIRQLAAAIPAAALHSVSVGPLRFPRHMFQRIESMYPDDLLLAGPLQQRGGLTSYSEEREAELTTYVSKRMHDAFPEVGVFSCTPTAT